MHFMYYQRKVRYHCIIKDELYLLTLCRLQLLLRMGVLRRSSTFCWGSASRVDFDEWTQQLRGLPCDALTTRKADWAEGCKRYGGFIGRTIARGLMDVPLDIILFLDRILFFENVSTERSCYCKPLLLFYKHWTWIKSLNTRAIPTKTALLSFFLEALQQITWFWVILLFELFFRWRFFMEN